MQHNKNWSYAARFEVKAQEAALAIVRGEKVLFVSETEEEAAKMVKRISEILDKLGYRRDA